MVTKIVVDEMGSRSKLIESVCERIVDKVVALSSNILWVKTKVCKINPPIDGDVENVSVEIKKEGRLTQIIIFLHSLRHCGRVARQSSAKACTAVRIRSMPLSLLSLIHI